MKKKFDELVIIADSLDQQGLHEEAGLVDLFLYKKGSVFSDYEREAVRAVAAAIDKLSKLSLISEPGKSTELIGLDGKKILLQGIVAEQYLAIHEWLNVFISEILQPNANLVPDSKVYQGLLEFTNYLKQALEEQHSRLLSVKNYYDSLKSTSKTLVQALDSLTVNNNIEDIEATADKLDEIRQEYSLIVMPLRSLLQKGSINLIDFKGAVENLNENIKDFLSEQSKKGETLRSFFEDSKVVSEGKSQTEERTYSLKWLIDNAKLVSAKAQSLLIRYLKVRQRRDDFRREKLKSFSVMNKNLDALERRYEYWMNRYKKEGVEEYNVEPAFDQYGGYDNFIQRLRFVRERFETEEAEEKTAALRSLTKKATEEIAPPLLDVSIDVNKEFVPKVISPNNAQIKEIEGYIENIVEAKKVLESSAAKFSNAVDLCSELYEMLNNEIKEALTIGRTQKDWKLFQKQIEVLSARLKNQLDLIIKNNDKVTESLASKAASYNRVVNVLFKY